MTLKFVANGYTRGEVDLISMFGYGDLVHHIDVPSSLYRMCVEKAFVESMSGSHVEALRRVYQAILNVSVYRHTEEFEKLTKFNASSVYND